MSGLNIITRQAVVVYQPQWPCIAVDAGLAYAMTHQMDIILAVGDFDSLPLPDDYHGSVVKFDAVKDQSDLELALLMVPKKYDVVHVYGGLGGRMDHTLVNLKLLYYRNYHFHLVLFDECNMLEVFQEGHYQLTVDPYQYLSFLSFERCQFSVSGVVYPLDHYWLNGDDTLPLSNQADGLVELTVHSGRLLVMKGNDYASTTTTH